MTRRAAIYTRISRDREGAGLGVERQEQDCRALAERLGWDVVKVYADNDLSAYSGKPRPGYRAMLDDLRAGQADAVIAWHTDRLHRSPKELEEYIDVCDPRGVVTHTVTAGPLDLSTPSGRAVARTLGAWARFESEQKAARIRRQKVQAVAAGKWRGGGRPFGFEADGVTVREDEAQVLRRASVAVIEGRSLASVVRELNDAGVRTSTGGAWRMDNLRNALKRPRNAGLIEVDGKAAGPAVWPAIVEENVWRAVLAILTDPTRRTNLAGPEPRWLGSGIYRCGVCGDVLRVVKTSGDRRGYTCESSRAHVSRLQAPLDDLVRGAIAERLASTPDLLAEEPDHERVRTSRTALEALRVRENELAELFAAGAISASQLSAGTGRFRDERERLEREIAEGSDAMRLGWLADAPDPAEAFLTASLDRQRAVLDALLAVTVLKAQRGRPPGWRPGAPPTIDPAFVRLDWK